MYGFFTAEFQSYIIKTAQEISSNALHRLYIDYMW